MGVLTNWFGYAANGIDLTSVSNSAGQFWHYGYNGIHQVTFVTNALNQVTGADLGHATTEPVAGFAAQRPDDDAVLLRSGPPPAAGNTNSLLQSIALQPQGLTTHHRRLHQRPAAGGDDQRHGVAALTVTNFWDGLNRLTGTVFPDGTTTSNVYDRLYLGAAKDRLGHWTSYGYDALEHLTSITDAREQCNPVRLVRLRLALQHHRRADQHDQPVLQQPGAADQHHFSPTPAA